ncbi:hypothetical protein [Shewanella putrefaciens]|uniref:hypothetical protein n=1 Tax=Shewanella putrefaciens TaxID=24 RepID=UPI0018E736F2|nr:hypothetical protein [Shewanella putrefaciens]
MKLLMFFSLSLFLTSCAAPLSQQYDTLKNKTPCCTKYSDIDYVPFGLKNQKFDLNDKSPVFALGKDKSYFKGFSLPDTSGKYFYIKSYFNGMFIGQYFDPIFFELNEKFELLEAFSLKMEFIDANIFDDSNAHMAGVFKPNAEARYLLVLTADLGIEAPVAETSPSVSTYMVGNTVNVMPVGGNTIQLEKSPIGSLSIELKSIVD